MFNLLEIREFGNNFKRTIFEHMLWIIFMGTSGETVLR